MNRSKSKVFFIYCIEERFPKSSEFSYIHFNEWTSKSTAKKSLIMKLFKIIKVLEILG